MAGKRVQIAYLCGFGNDFATEAVAGALPVGQNSPQQAPLGLYPEKFSGSAFTAPRASNMRSWFYRITPSVVHGEFRPIEPGLIRTAPLAEKLISPNPLRWDPFELPTEPVDFIDGLITVAANGDAAMHAGIAVHVYCATRSMQNRFFYDADGELLIVPEMGDLLLATECGKLELAPGEIAVVPRGMKFRVELAGSTARGYVCENYGALLQLPERGPIGSDGLANSRDFLTPTAAFEDTRQECELVCKMSGRLFAAQLPHSPLDVVAWHGNLAPYKYDLRRFNTMGSISYDHPDPSIFTVLTSQSDTPGVANADFVIFPPRWLVAEQTFRPPWFHRNVMSEFMGLIYGDYDAKSGGGFVPGGSSLHNCMTAHGPDARTYASASSTTLQPQKLEDTLAFMFESRYPLQPTSFAMNCGALQADYRECWQGLRPQFSS